jgi:hemerythrin
MLKNSTEYTEMKKTARNAAKVEYSKTHITALDILKDRTFTFAIDYNDDNNLKQHEEFTATVSAMSAVTDKDKRKGMTSLANRMQDFIAASIASETRDNVPKPNRNKAKECLENLAIAYGITEYKADNKHVATVHAFMQGVKGNGQNTDIKVNSAILAVERFFANWITAYEARIMLKGDTEYKPATKPAKKEEATA